MKISYNWIKEYVDVKSSPSDLANTLTMAGLAVEGVERIGDDHILEIEVTANRPDWLSMIGVARELAAITGAKLKVPVVKSAVHPGLPVERGHSHATAGAGSPQSAVSVVVEDKKLCPKYTARVIRNVNIGESPAWLKSRLDAIGVRPVNNVVDITNFCLFETGEPTHAFDMNRLNGQGLAVRRAVKGEKIMAIDGIERNLDIADLVIADKSGPVAIAGIMGGLKTEVSLSTKDILLEAAFFDPISIRRTSRRMGLSTESSYRFERGVDRGNVVYSSDRALELIIGIAGGQAGEFIDLEEVKEPKKTVEFRYERCGKVLGIKMDKDGIGKTLESLGLEVGPSSDKALKLGVPTFRRDLNDEIDIIEEVARIHGYDNIPDTIPKITGNAGRPPADIMTAKTTRASLCAIGLDEIITYSLTSRSSLAMARMAGDDIVDIKNPLTSEQEVMRPGLMAGILNAVLWNMNRKTKDLKLFEIGNVYAKNGGTFSEKKYAAMIITGVTQSAWTGISRQASFFELKGIVESLFLELGITDYSFGGVKYPGLLRSASASIDVGSDKAGVIGEVSNKVLSDFDIKDRVYYCEICLDTISKACKFEKKYRELPRYPSVIRDVSIVTASDVSNDSLVSMMKRSGGAILKDVNLIDRYSGKQIPEGKVGLTYRLEYQDPNKTLEEKEVLISHARIMGELEAKYGARLR